METIFNALLDLITTPPIIYLFICPLPFYCFALVWCVFHSGGGKDD